MKTMIKKSLALIFAVLILVSTGAAGMSAFAADSTGIVGTVNVGAKFFRYNEVLGEWIETEKAQKGEILRVRVYADTDYYTTSGKILLFYDDAFFADAYERNKIIETYSNEYYQNLCNMTTQIAFYSKDGTAVTNFIKNGIFDEEFAQTHTCFSIMYMFSYSAANQKLSGDEWLVEFELIVKEDTAITRGSVFTTSSAFCSPDNMRSFSDIPYGEAGGRSEDTQPLHAVYVTVEAVDSYVSTLGNVILDANGGCFADGETEYVAEAEIGTDFFLGSVQYPIKDGYIFAGWAYADETDVSYDAVTVDYEDITVFAIWVEEPNEYMLILDANGGEFGNGMATYAFALREGVRFDITDNVVREGYRFAGWLNENGELVESIVMPACDLVLKAAWEAIDYCTVTYWLDEDGTSVYLQEAYEKGDYLVYPAPPTVPGYEFDSWSEVEGAEITGDLDVYPSYTAVEYYVTVCGIYGDVVDEWIAYYGDEITLAELYSKADMDAMLADNGDYYTFDCWKHNGIEMTDSTVITVTDDVKIEGAFTAMDAKIIFDANGALFANGEETVEVTLKYDDEITADMYPEIPVYAGHKFKAWSVELAGNPMDELEKTVFITWTKKNYSVNYYVGDIVEKSVTLAYGDTVDATVMPSSDNIPEGYTFVGWSLERDASVPGDLGTVGEGEVNVYAVFEANTDVSYAVEIHKQYFDGTYILEETREFANGVTGESAPYFVTEIEGFTFNPALSYIDAPVAGDGSTVLCVYYDRNRYDIVTYSDGEFFEGYSGYYGEIIDYIEIPEKIGCTFEGWINRATGEDVILPLTVPAESLVLDAVWVTNVYTVTYETGTDDVIPDALYTFSEEVELPVLKKQGYTFEGWSNNGETVGNSFLMPDCDVDLVAIWTPATDTPYKIEYYFRNKDGYTYDLTVKELTGTTDKQMLIMPEGVEGFTFDAENSLVKGTIAPDGSSVFEIYYERNTYNFATCIGGSVFNNYSYLYDTVVESAYEPSKVGYTFNGWVYKETGEAVVFPFTMPAKDVEVEANWVINEYVVSFDTNGGEEIAPVTVKYDESFTLPTAQKAGHSLAFWRSSEGGSYTAGQSIRMPATNVTFTAVWLVQSRKVTYIIGSESVSFEVVAGQAVPQPDMSNYENAQLLYWVDENGNKAEIPDVMPENDLTFTAKLRYAFGENPYGITAEYDDGSFSCDGSELEFDVEKKDTEKESGGIYIGEENYKQLDTYDIGFSHGGTEIQPESGKTVEIRIPVPAAYKDGTRFVVFNRFSDGTSEQIPATKEGGFIVIKVNRLGEFEVLVKSETTILTLPDKTSYAYKEALNLSGLTLEVLDENGNKTVISDTSEMTVSGYNPKKIGTQLLTVEYDGTSAQFEVKVAYTWWQILIRILLLGFLWY